MKRITRLWAAALALVLLAGCGYQRTEPLPYPEPAASEPGKTVAYVPLDDRPDNVERVVYLAESLGYALAMPDRDLYRTALDGQPLNENGTQHGDMGRLYQWVLDQEAAGCDRYILSLDQLLSGGLVSSRTRMGYGFDSPSGGVMLTTQLLEGLLEALSADPDNRVWLLDTVMRLAPTVGYEGGTLEQYNLIRAFGALPRPTLEGGALTVENIVQNYWETEPDWQTFCEEAEQSSGIDPERYYREVFESLEDNLYARQRKLRLSDEVQRILSQPGHEKFRLLIGIDDSSLEDCIQKNEIALLRQGLRAEKDEDGKKQLIDWLLSGVDDLAFKAVARMYLDETGWGAGYSTKLQYIGGTEDRPACEYDFQPLSDIVFEHFQFFGLQEAKAVGLHVLVLTQPEDESLKQAYINLLLQTLEDNRKLQMPTILIDASNGTYGTEVYEALTKQAELGYLLAYSGMLDMAIVTGTALSHGVARLAVLKNGASTDACDRAWARTLADSILKDFCYKGVVRNDLLSYIRNDLGGDPNNFYSPELDREDLLRRLEAGMEQETAPVIRNLERSAFLSSHPYNGEPEERHWGGVALENYRFPWDRAFEIGMDIRLGEFTD